MIRSTTTIIFLLAAMALNTTACASVPDDLRVGKKLDGSLDPSKVRIAAHRGASAIAPENTTASIAAAIDADSDFIEFDVRATADGDLLLFHDSDLKRYGGGKKAFAELSTADALKLDVGSVFSGKFAEESPPTLAAAIQQCLDGRAIPLIEHKAGSAAAYSATLRELDAVDKVIVQSFNWKFLTELHALEPDLKLGALGKKEVTGKTITEINAFAPAMVGWKDADITSAAIDRFHEAGFAVAIWTVNDLRRAKALAASGIDIVITDKPGEIRTALSTE